MNECCKDTWAEVTHVYRNRIGMIFALARKIAKGENVGANASLIMDLIGAIDKDLKEMNGKVYKE